VQYSAASFIETINSGSLTMDPDEFLAHMVAAGVADMPAASPRASAARATSPAFAASAAEDVAVLPPPAGQLPHPPASSTGTLLHHLYGAASCVVLTAHAAGDGCMIAEHTPT
jgi:hypothetical protein